MLKFIKSMDIINRALIKKNHSYYLSYVIGVSKKLEAN